MNLWPVTTKISFGINMSKFDLFTKVNTTTNKQKIIRSMHHRIKFYTIGMEVTLSIPLQIFQESWNLPNN